MAIYKKCNQSGFGYDQIYNTAPKSPVMIQNYLKTALRNLSKRKVYSILNIFGLAVGMDACLIIGLFVLEELSYDRFHEHADRIYRLRTHAVMGDNEWNSALVSPALARR